MFYFQVECKKAQPKEVMLPANLAKTRAAGRTAYGELVVLSGGPTATVGAPSTSLRYAPYPLPATVTGHQQSHHHHHHHQQHQQQTAHIIPLTTSNPSILQYTTAPHHQQTLYDAAAAVSYKIYNQRLLAATAAASLRSHHHPHPHSHPTQQHHPRPPTATLSYPLSELLGVQGLDVSALYGLPTATLGL